MKTGIELIAAERERQVSKERWTPGHDDHHCDGSLALAGASYALAVGVRSHPSLSDGRVRWALSSEIPPPYWPWDEDWWKPTPDDPIRQLVKAGALIAAEIDRLQRAAERKGEGG